jgi:hypothetical protein
MSGKSPWWQTMKTIWQGLWLGCGFATETSAPRPRTGHSSWRTPGSDPASVIGHGPSGKAKPRTAPDFPRPIKAARQVKESNGTSTPVHDQDWGVLPGGA